MDKEIIDIFKSLNKMLDSSYIELSSITDTIINNKSTNTHLIESVLDLILSNFIDERFCALFLKLCNYYKTVNEEYALDYMNIYNEEMNEYEDENDKIKRYKSSNI